jgi:hypothetical protein
MLGLCDHRESKTSDLSMDALAGQAGNLIALYAKDEYKDELTETEMLELLGSAIGEYVKVTQSYKVACHMAGEDIPRMIVLHMPNPASRESMFVRPNPLPARTLSAEEIQEVTGMILAQDRINHPERFKSGQILEFKPKKVEL